MIEPTEVVVSGDRFEATYRIDAVGAAARARAEDITIEQTVEFPADLVPEDGIREHVFGRIEELRQEDGQTIARISFAEEVAGATLPQLLNVLFGNVSIKPGIRIEHFQLPAALSARFKGPRFGVSGLRKLTGRKRGPLLCAALKPMGLSAGRLASIAYDAAAGGADLVKDDHGISTQPFAPFEERVKACADAVGAANDKTGASALYFPTLSVPAEEMRDAARYAKAQGAGGLLVSPGTVGFDAMRMLAEDDDLGLAIMAHPAMLGTYTMSRRHGLSHGFLFGQLARLAGADSSVFPTYGGRFSFTRRQCREIAQAATEPFGGYAPMLPAPGGGITLARVPELLEFYGENVLFLIGGELHRQSGVAAGVRQFRQQAALLAGE